MWDATDAILRLAKIFGLYEQVQGAYTAYMDAKRKADAMTTAMEQDVIVVNQGNTNIEDTRALIAAKEREAQRLVQERDDALFSVQQANDAHNAGINARIQDLRTQLSNVNTTPEILKIASEEAFTPTKETGQNYATTSHSSTPSAFARSSFSTNNCDAILQRKAHKKSGNWKTTKQHCRSR